MIFTAGNILLIGSILLFVSIIVGKTGYRFGVPALLLFLVVGMLFGKIQQLFVGGVGFDFDDVVGERLEHRVPALKNVNADQVAEARGIARIQNLRLDVENRGFQAVGIGNRLD